MDHFVATRLIDASLCEHVFVMTRPRLVIVNLRVYCASSFLHHQQLHCLNK